MPKIKRQVLSYSDVPNSLFFSLIDEARVELRSISSEISNKVFTPTMLIVTIRIEIIGTIDDELGGKK